MAGLRPTHPLFTCLLRRLTGSRFGLLQGAQIGYLLVALLPQCFLGHTGSTAGATIQEQLITLFHAQRHHAVEDLLILDIDRATGMFAGIFLRSAYINQPGFSLQWQSAKPATCQQPEPCAGR